MHSDEYTRESYQGCAGIMRATGHGYLKGRGHANEDINTLQLIAAATLFEVLALKGLPEEMREEAQAKIASDLRQIMMFWTDIHEPL